MSTTRSQQGVAATSPSPPAEARIVTDSAPDWHPRDRSLAAIEGRETESHSRGVALTECVRHNRLDGGRFPPTLRSGKTLATETLDYLSLDPIDRGRFIIRPWCAHHPAQLRRRGDQTRRALGIVGARSERAEGLERGPP